MSSPPSQPLHVQYPSLPPPPKSGNTAPSQSGANSPSLVKIQDGRKIYTVRGVTFEIDQHYDLIKAIGLGAYGLVCSAIDLRYVPGSQFFDKELLDREVKGGACIKAKTGELFRYQPSRTAANSEAASTTKKPPAGAPPHEVVSSLRHDPYVRGKLSNNIASPYVAIKKIPKLFNDLVDGKRVLREVKILQYLRGHENIVRLHDLLYPRQTLETFKDLYIVTELLDTDLHLVLKSRQPLEEDHLRFIIYQLVKSLIFTHSSGIIHRDLKPGNMLLTGSCELKVCDYGLARGGIPPPSLQGGGGSESSTTDANGMLTANATLIAASPMIDQLPKKPANLTFQKSVESQGLNPQSGANHGGCNAMDLTDYVITRYYRPPELLIMSNYGYAVDMWSVGCIFAEIILHKPVFPGKDYLSQLTLIAQTQGLVNMPKTPEQLDQCFVGGVEGKNYLKDLLFGRGRKRDAGDTPPSPGKFATLENLRTSLFGPDGQRYITDGAMAFVAPLLSFDPSKRPTALEALRHPYFAKMYAAEDELWKDSTLPMTAKCCKKLSPEESAAEVEYESEEEAQNVMWEFDQRELQEMDLRQLFWNEIEKFQRRRERRNTKLGLPTFGSSDQGSPRKRDSSVSPGRQSSVTLNVKSSARESSR